jgi:type IV secretion system protein VirD4
MRIRIHHLVRRCRRAVPGPLAWLLAWVVAFGGVLIVADTVHRLARWRPTRPQAAFASVGLVAALLAAKVVYDRRRARVRLSSAHGSARWGDPRSLAGAHGLILGQAGSRRAGRDRRAWQVERAAQADGGGRGGSGGRADAAGHDGRGDGSRRSVREPSRQARRGPFLRFAGEAHLLTLAPTGSGKGIGAVLPNLLDYPGSVLSTDIKGEAYAVSARWRRQVLGQTIAALDPFSLVGGTSAYNPLDLIDPGSDDAYDTARLIASMLVVPEPGQHEPFWDEEAASLLAGFVLHVAASAAPEHRHLGTVRHLLTLGATDFSSVLDRMARTEACHGLIHRAANRIRQKDERLLAGVLASTNRHTEFLDSPHLLATLKSSTFRLEDFKHWRLTVYLVLPPHHLRTHGRWLRLLTASALRVLTMTPGRPAWRVLLLLDEFAALGRMQSIEEAITYSRGYGVSIWMLTQDLAQLRDLYPRSWETLLANVKVLQAFGTADQFTAEYLSKLTGQATVSTRGSNLTRGTTTAGNLLFLHRQQGTAEQTGETGRRLLLADEVRRLPADRQLLFISGREPLLTQRIDYRQARVLTARADPNPMYREV